MICVDASVAAKWLFDEEHSDLAEALYEHWRSSSYELKRQPAFERLRSLGLRKIVCLHDAPNWAAPYVDDWIVADSIPENEWLETRNKARALLAAAELAHAGVDTPLEQG